MPHPENPLILQSDFSILVEVDSPRFEEARAQLARFAELVKMPEHIHTYRITPISLWNACAAGLTVEAILDALNDLSRYEPPAAVLVHLREIAGRFGMLKLERDPEDRLLLHAVKPALAEEISRHAPLHKFLGERLAPCSFVVQPPWRGPLKRALIHLGWPVEDLAGYEKAPALPFVFREQTAAGKPFQLRNYQQEAVRTFASSHGSGVVLLPCGGGKTLVGMGCMAQLQQHTLILTTSISAAR